jgi:predicted Rossmann fold flavoprotein
MIEANNRAFPKSERAVEVVLFFENAMRMAGVEVITGVTVKTIVAKDGAIISIEAMGRQLTTTSFILATGGLSHPETGSTGDGFDWLTNLGHTVHAPTPSLVPLRTKESWVKQVAGVTLPKIKITFTSVGGKKFSRTGPILFTHTGISGPTVLNAAAEVGDWLQEGTVTASIDLFAMQDVGTLDESLLASVTAHKNKLVRNVIAEFAPAGMGELILLMLPTIDPESQVNALSKESRRSIVDLMKNLPLTITSLMGFDKAVVADGGISLEEVDTRTMRSRKINNLFITGDLLHIARPSGGYSLQLCWTTGFVAGTNA